VSLLASHGHFADMGPLEWVVVGLAAVVGSWVVWKAVRYTIHPGEEEPDHPKRMILGDDPAPPAAPDAPGKG
jgi:hypothetical protein